MSGYVTVFNLDGAPVDPVLLQRMTDSMAYRGPDRGGLHIDGAIGLGHRLLATTFEAEREEQPCTLDGRFWIVADARIDDRDRLKRELVAVGRMLEPTVTDVELILHAYQAWGTDCVDHLLGDFSFVIWDGTARKVFCARDHWGVKLLYYAHTKNSLIISNELNCIRLHPEVSNRLNDLAIADYLLVGHNPELATTSFADIQRIPPAHWMQVTPQSTQQRQYWVLPHDQQVRFKRHGDYIERFKELLDLAVGDRLRTERVAILMSGGLDSPTIAAAAKRLLGNQSSHYEFDAYTLVYEWLIADHERAFVQAAADAIDIPLHIYGVDDTPLTLSGSTQLSWVPEPCHWPFHNTLDEATRQIASHGRMVLYGEDGDTMLSSEPVAQMLSSQGVWRTLVDVVGYMRLYRRRPTFGLGIMKRMRQWRGLPDKKRQRPSFPSWLNPYLVSRFDLEERWKSHYEPMSVPPRTLRPSSYMGLLSPYMQNFMESLDAGITSIPLEYRLPLFDVRLSTYLTSLPVLPWCIRKTLLREAGLGILPELVRLRPKTPLSASPIEALLQQLKAHDLGQVDPASPFSSYVSTSFDVSDTTKYRDFRDIWPACFNAWLNSCYHSKVSS